uniref:Odorant receptor n=1 Tax=Conogethes punctiferalis TaxID=1133088 RepID=A0A1Y9TJJ7_CONPF|nr:odorant receptor 49 [Conogethes punctiferalis]
MNSGIFTALRAFIMKEGFDFTSTDINLHTFHPQLRMFLVPMGIFFNNENSIIRFIWPFMSSALSMVAIGFEAIFVFHGIEVKDYAFATECFCYFILLGVIPLVYGSVLFNRQNMLQIMESMNNDFKCVCKLDARYREHFLKGQLLIWQLCFFWLWFTGIIAIMYFAVTLVPLLYLTLFANQDEHTVRPLIFPMWLPEDDPYRTPNYETFFILQINICFIFVQAFAVYVYIQFHVLLHNYYMLDLVIMHFGVIFEGLDETVAYLPVRDERRVETQRILNKRMERIVTWHNSVFKLTAMISKVQGAPLVYQVMVTSMAVCLMMYQIAEKLNEGSIDIMFSMLITATTIQLWAPCYLGTMLRNKAFDVGEACWLCGWHETSLGRLLRQDIVIVILRSQQPLSIKFIGLPYLSLETFSSHMSSAYSYFNMLRHYN